jgi:hypothetical protein
VSSFKAALLAADPSVGHAPCPAARRATDFRIGLTITAGYRLVTPPPTAESGGEGARCRNFGRNFGRNSGCELARGLGARNGHALFALQSVGWQPRRRSPFFLASCRFPLQMSAGWPTIIRGPQSERDAMKALILYVLFVCIGAAISAAIGYYVERQFGSAMSLLVFLALFFTNFAVSWLAVILVMDGSLRDGQGRQSQLDIERSGRASIAQRAPKA